MNEVITCITCGTELSGKQTKFCSIKCKNRSLQSYEVQNSRGISRKKELLSLKGPYCSVCGYNRNWSALCFYHLRDKQFGLSLRELSNHRWDLIITEAKKCVVLCANCHQEVHNPDANLSATSCTTGPYSYMYKSNSSK